MIFFIISGLGYPHTLVDIISPGYHHQKYPMFVNIIPFLCFSIKWSTFGNIIHFQTVPGLVM